ncbi:hypothetical protein [Streptomyces niveus]|uniref:hypothetical protein n=1 Tax=Streptomyces niveus TaxID=193462 RepID=UPI00114CD9C3|nr:hypothetical protein [Streptomyces niveus]
MGIAGAGVVAAVAAGAFLVGVAWEDSLPPVTESARPPAESAYPQTRAEAAELKKAGEELPENWEILTTEEIKGRYVSQRVANAPKAEDIDPGMARRVGD